VSTQGATTHLLVLFDDAGRITSFGEIDEDAMNREGQGQIYVSTEGRYSAQLKLTDELRKVSRDDILSQYVVSHDGGSNPKIVRRPDR
jgi:hypothetical protein